jgi:hypothetical protein
MKPRTLIIAEFCIILALSLVPGCSDDSAEPLGLQSADVEEVIVQAGILEPLGPDKDEITDSQTLDEGGFRYVTEEHDAAKNIQEITYLGLNDDIVWPGNLIKGAKLHQFVYEPVVGVGRNPVTISINLENSGSGSIITQTIDRPQLSTIRQGINDLLENALQSGTTYAAKAQFDRKQVYSESQLNLTVGADLKYGGGSVGTKFNWDSTTRKNKIIAKYQQLYYTIDMDTPSSPAAVFAATNTLEGLKAAIPPGSCPVYVAGVTYGMMALVFIETDYTESELTASLDAAYSGFGLEVEIRTGLTKRQVLENSSVKTVVYGGASAGLNQIYNGYQGFIDVVNASINLGTEAPGAPLIYKFRHLGDNTLANVTLTSQYSLTRMIRLRQAIRIVANKFVCEVADDDCIWDDNNPDITRFRVKVNATQRTSATDPGVDYCLEDSLVYSGGPQEMAKNSEHLMGTSLLFELDAENYDYELATIKLWAYVHENDGAPCADDAAEAYVTVPSSEFGSNPHKIILHLPNARLRCEVSIEMANKPVEELAVGSK